MITTPNNKDLPRIATDIVFGAYNINVEETEKCRDEKAKHPTLKDFLPIVIGTKEKPDEIMLMLTHTQWRIFERSMNKFMKMRKQEIGKRFLAECVNLTSMSTAA